MSDNPNWYRDIRLMPREQEILQLVCEGKTDFHISVQCGITYETAKWYRKCLREKFNSTSTAEMVTKAVSLGFVNTEKILEIL